MIFSESETWTPVVLMLARFGFSQGFVASYLTMILIYPTVLTSSAMGIAVTMSKLATVLAPMIAEVDAPTNLLILLGVVVLATVVS